jgi:hypothetical protein
VIRVEERETRFLIGALQDFSEHPAGGLVHKVMRVTKKYLGEAQSVG